MKLIKLYYRSGVLFLMLDLFCLGVDFKVKYLTIGEKKLKLAIWDTGERSKLLLCVVD